MDSNNHSELEKSIEDLQDFVEKTTGKRATASEIVFALDKYFVRKEILEFIALYRKENS